MEIGYACLTVGVPGTKLRSCRAGNADAKRLRGIIASNLKALDRMLDYNIEQGIGLLRLSSDIIPLGSHPANRLNWDELFAPELQQLGEKARQHGIRLSMHPGQYTVLNSLHEEVVGRAKNDLRYHARFLDALGTDARNKIVLHIGGAYGDKEASAERFGKHYESLEQTIKERLIIENDDRIFNIREVLDIGLEHGIPVVYDNLHNQVNPCNGKKDSDWIRAASATWTAKDGSQLIHYAQQDPGKRAGAHAERIDLEAFLDFAAELREAALETDIMLEVKDKNLSAVKCVNGLKGKNIRLLEEEWARYKYLVLEHSPAAYGKIRELLKDKNAYPVRRFYRLIDEALSQKISPGHAVNAAEHVWGYFKNTADEKTKEKAGKEIRKIAEGGSARRLKGMLWKMARAEDAAYLLQSLYFKDVM